MKNPFRKRKSVDERLKEALVMGLQRSHPDTAGLILSGDVKDVEARIAPGGYVYVTINLELRR